MQAPNDAQSPLLSMAPGFYLERPVTPALRQHFSAVWLHRKPPSVTARSAVVADVSAELVWCGGALKIAGPDRQVSLEPVPPGGVAVGVRFRPGALASVVRASAAELVGARIAADCVWGRRARSLAEALADAETPQVAAARLESALAAMAARGQWREPSSAALLACAQQRAPGRSLIPQLRAALGLSERTLRRSCQRAFGYGPKTLERVLRIQHFLKLAQQRPRLDLAGLALAAGYADQSHLCRDARRLTGLAPLEIVAQLGRAAGSPAA